MKTCWKCERMFFGVKGSAPGSWNITVTMSFPIWRFRSNCWKQNNINLTMVKEGLGRCDIFWKIADILGKESSPRATNGIAVAWRGSAANFCSNSRIMGHKERKGIFDNKCRKYLQKFGKKAASNPQKGKHLILAYLSRKGYTWNFSFTLFSNKTWIWSKIFFAIPPEVTRIKVVARGENSLSPDAWNKWIPKNYQMNE